MNNSGTAPQYVARRSIFGAYGGRILLCIIFVYLLFPVAIWYIVKAATYRLEFYQDKIIVRSGLIATKENRECSPP